MRRVQKRQIRGVDKFGNMAMSSTSIIQTVAPYNSRSLTSFLLGLSEGCTSKNITAEFYKKNFHRKKYELCKLLFNIYNREVFDSKLPKDLSMSFDEISCYVSGSTAVGNETIATGEEIRTASIKFSPLLVDRAQRLRDTLLHELCHVATWVIDELDLTIKENEHGDVWHNWGLKAEQRIPRIPRITERHDYQLQEKYATSRHKNKAPFIFLEIQLEAETTRKTHRSQSPHNQTVIRRPQLGESEEDP